MDKIVTGLKNRAQTTVTKANTAATFGTGALEVFSTPAMVALMEEAAFLLLKNLGYDSVGTGLNISHSKACLVGEKIEAEAEILSVDRRKVEFKVTAFCPKGEIGSGTHTRFIIDTERFMQKLKSAE